MNTSQSLTRSAGRLGVAGGILGLASLAIAIGGEASQGMTEFVGSPLATLGGWAGFVSAGLLVVALIGMAVRFAEDLTAVGRAALLTLGLATSMTVGAAATLALIVPTLATEAPDLIDSPPTAVPPTFILSGLVMGICAITLAVGLRRTGVTGFGINLLIAGGIVSMVPLPSRYFLLALAAGLLCLTARPAYVRREGAVLEAA